MHLEPAAATGRTPEPAESWRGEPGRERIPTAGQSQPGQREAIGRGMPCRRMTRRAHKPAQQVGNGPRDGRGPGAQGRCPGDVGLADLERPSAADHAASGLG